jgi:membrane-bound lytic murein transglycosylase D
VSNGTGLDQPTSAVEGASGQPSLSELSGYKPPPFGSSSLRERARNDTHEVFEVRDEDDDISSLFGPEIVQKFDIPIVFNDAVKYYIGWFSTEKRKVFGNWLRRSRQYVPVITEILGKQGMPEDLVYLAMIESGFNAKAYSPAKASGPWQFIYSTGGRYGLKVNYWVDERRDPEKSTVAAAKYLRDLFNQFGCWYLAAAGYNAGERRVERAIEKHNTNDFWELARYNALPRETREYIPKLIAAAIIAKDPEHYGFGSIEYDAPAQFVEVQVPGGVSLRTVAKAASADLGLVKSINPELLRGVTPPQERSYAVKLPRGVHLEGFGERLELMASKDRKIRNIATHKVKKSDTLEKILKRYRVSYVDLALVNEFDEDLKLRPGMVLNIPRYAGAPQKERGQKTSTDTRQVVRAEKEREGSKKKVVQKEPAPEGGRTVVHVVKKGETLSSISSRYGIDVAELKAQNNLKGDKVYPNMKLRLAGYKTEKKPAVRYHVVKKGETLSSISSRYGIEVAELKAQNKLKSDAVQPRMKLRIASAKD